MNLISLNSLDFASWFSWLTLFIISLASFNFFILHREQYPLIHQSARQQPTIAATMPRWDFSENVFIFHIFFSLRCQRLQALWNQQWQRSLPTNAAAARWAFMIQIIDLKWVGCFWNCHHCRVKPIFAMRVLRSSHPPLVIVIWLCPPCCCSVCWQASLQLLVSQGLQQLAS